MSRLILSRSMSATWILMSPAMTMPLSRTRSSRSAACTSRRAWPARASAASDEGDPRRQGATPHGEEAAHRRQTPPPTAHRLTRQPPTLPPHVPLSRHRVPLPTAIAGSIRGEVGHHRHDEAGPGRSRDPLNKRRPDQSVTTVSNASGFASSHASTASASRPSPYSFTTMSSSDP